MELSLTSSPVLQFVVLLPLLPLLCLLYLRRQDPKKQPRAHGLKVYPLVGTVPHFVKNQRRFLDWSTDVLKRDPSHTLSFKALGSLAAPSRPTRPTLSTSSRPTSPTTARG